MDTNTNMIKVLNQSDAKVRDAVYYGVAFALSNLLVKSDDLDKNLKRIKVVAIMDVLNELAIINYDYLKNIILNVVYNKIDLINAKNSDYVNIKEFDDIFGYPNFMSEETEDNIDNNINMFKLAMTYTDLWYKKRFED